MKPGKEETIWAEALLRARSGGPLVAGLAPKNSDEAYHLQDAVMAKLGEVGGWKVGAKGLTDEPMCAPMPLACTFFSGVSLGSSTWPLRGIEVELALRLGRDLEPGMIGLSVPDIWAAFDAVLPAIEIVETRLAGWEEASPLTKLADFQSHGGVILGSPRPMPAAPIDLSAVEARLAVDGKEVVATVGGNPARNLERILLWLVRHCEGRKPGLRKGQVIITGSCTGMSFVGPDAHVHGSIAGLGDVFLTFSAS